MEQIKSDKKLKICYIPYYGYETNNLAFDEKYQYRWTNILKERLEREGHSIATYDINTVKDSDFIISFDNTYFQNVRHFWNIWKAGKLGRTLHIDYEPPSAMAKIHSDRGLKVLSKFMTIMTYNDNVVNGKTILKGVVGDFYEKPRPYKHDFKNRKLLGMVANNRSGKLIEHWPSGLYIKRREVAEYFAENHAKNFDLYGDYWPDTLNSKGPVSRDKKFDVISKYRFIISYDSITNQNGYISEKIFDAFKAKTMPVYWGADNVTDYIPKDCFIDKRDFSDYEELYSYLENIPEDEYEARIKNIEKYLKSDLFKSTFSSEAVAEQVFQFLQKKPRHVNYFFAAAVIAWFEFLRRTKHYYNWHNYYYDSRPTVSNSLVKYVDKEVRKNVPQFIVYVSVAKDENIYLSFGNSGKYEKVKLNDLTVNGGYSDGAIFLPYDTIYEKGGSVGVFSRRGEKFIKINLQNFTAVNVTDWDNFTRFKAVGNKIMITKKLKYYAHRIKRVIKP